ncbi:MAG: hypothetical protein WCA19_24105 [Candidatus Acidiferrales bacterium]
MIPLFLCDALVTHSEHNHVVAAPVDVVGCQKSLPLDVESYEETYE